MGETPMVNLTTVLHIDVITFPQRLMLLGDVLKDLAKAGWRPMGISIDNGNYNRIKGLQWLMMVNDGE
jgi:hypothetical protein